jgi:hypothetical protein
VTSGKRTGGDRDRQAWEDHETRQRFEHTLIDRKITWLLLTQTLLFAGYGVTFTAKGDDDGLGDLRNAVIGVGTATAILTFAGVFGVVRSKWLSWRDYQQFFGDGRRLPAPLNSRKLQWGVRTRNTYATLLPDLLLPLGFAAAWMWLALRP